MARKLKESANATKVDAVPGIMEGTESPANPGLREFKPFKGTGELPPAKFTEKTKVYHDKNGEEFIRKETVFVSAGEPRYKVSPDGELIKVYMKRGGVGTKLVYQFKRKYAENPDGISRRNKDAKFRDYLRKQGVPGA